MSIEAEFTCECTSAKEDGMARFMIRAAVAVSSLALLLGGGFWDKSPFLDWSEDQVVRLLTRSPWAAVVQATVQQDGSAKIQGPASEACTDCATGSVFEDVFTEGGGIDPGAGGIPRRVKSASDALGKGSVVRRFAIRFVTAKPIRMAFARHGVLVGRGGPEDAHRFVDSTANADAILVSISILDGAPAELDLPTGSVAESIFLSLKQSGRTVGASQYLSPAQTGQPEGIIVFPRIQEGEPTISLADKEATLVFRMGGIKIRKQFKLRDMVFQGNLEL
jgi:hypothetical protein